MNVKKFKKCKIITRVGCIVEIAAWLLLLICAIIGLPSDIYYISVLIVSLILMITSCGLVIAANIKTRNCRVLNIKAVYKNVEKYGDLPYCEIKDYGGELEIVRNNYAADLNKSKNVINEKEIRKNLYFKTMSFKDDFLDFSVLEKGEIYYGYFCEAFNNFNLTTSCNKHGLIIVLYSTEKYYNENPEELKHIYTKLFYGRELSLMSDRSIFNNKLPETITNGYTVYMTSLIAERGQLPVGYMSNKILPIIASPENSTSAFVIDCKYWSEKLIGSFAYRNNIKKYNEYNLYRISGFKEKSCPDYAAELDRIRKEFIDDTEKTPGDLPSEDPFPSFEYANIKLYYAYILNNEIKFKKNYMVIPYVGIFSDDEHFKSNPKDLETIAEKLKNNRTERKNIKKVIKLKTYEIMAFNLPNEITDGYNVILTAIFVLKEGTPTPQLANHVVPIYCTHKYDTGWMFIMIESKYWGEGFQYEFVHTDE